MAENEEIIYGSEAYETFTEALHVINEYLAKKIAGDGEGATALFEVKAVGCESKEQAKILAKSIVCSNLTKTAIAGHDANWGRILCAMGYSGAQFDPCLLYTSFRRLEQILTELTGWNGWISRMHRRWNFCGRR